jgi:hypothetical protein
MTTVLIKAYGMIGNSFTKRIVRKLTNAEASHQNIFRKII